MKHGLSQGAVLRQDLRETLVLAFPLIGAQLALFAQHMVEVMLAGHLGPRVLGAVAIGTNIWGLGLMAIVGVMMAVSPSVAQLDGAGRRGEVAGLFRQAVWLAVGLGVATQQAAWWGGPALARVMGIEEALVAEVTVFLRAMSLGGPALGLFCACRGLTDGLSMPRVSLVFGVLALVLLTPLAWAMMYGRLGFPAMGALGCGIASAVVMWVSSLGYLAHVRFSARYRDIGWGRGGLAPDVGAILALVRIGVPMGVSVVMEAGLFSATALLIGTFGDVAIGSHQIALNVAALSFMVPLGLANAITVRVGNAVGRGDAVAVRRAGLVGISAALVTQSIPCALMLLVPHSIVAVYTSDAGLLAGAASLLALAALFQLSDGVQVASNGALRGLKDARVPMYLTTFSYWGVGMPLGWALAFPLGLGVEGMWIGLIGGLTCAAGLLLGRFHLRSRRMVVLGRVPVVA